MEGHLVDGVVRVGANARERFYDSSGYGTPDGEGLRLAPVEAAHLLYRGDLDAVVERGSTTRRTQPDDVDGMGFREFLGTTEGLVARFLVYTDLRERGFYLSPARAGWVDDTGGDDFVVYPRGEGPWSDDVAYRMRVVPERDAVPTGSLGDVVLAVVDEESELTYLETDRPEIDGSSGTALDWREEGTLLDDRVLVWDPPAGLYDQGFYGQPLDEGASALQLSLVEAAYLAERGVLTFDGESDEVVERGRAVEGDRFDRRLAVYAELRERGVVPKTGFKFGADFRTYADVESVENLGHSELLVRVLPPGHEFSPRDLSLDVRLAHGVRKRMVFAVPHGEGVEWMSVGRLTP